MDAKDPYRAANLLLQQHGGRASSIAAQRAKDLRAAGDEQGEWVWLQVYYATFELMATAPAADQTTH